MRFIFSKLFYALLALGLVPLSLSWNRPVLRWLALAYDLVLLAVATFDAWNSKLPNRVRIERHFGSRFAVGAETEVRIDIANHTPRDLSLVVKDEYPPQMKLAGAREARVHVDAQTSASLAYWLTPPKRGRFQFGLIAVRFLSSWRLVWKQTHVGETTAVKVYPNMRRARGDNAGLLVFGRKIKASLPPKRGAEHLDAALEALYAVEPEMIEPSYARAFEFISANSRRRALVVVITDLVDEEGSRELLSSLKLLRPRHLPLVVTIADRDLKAVVREPPENVREMFTQSVAEEIIHLREAALRLVESQGGLALDVTAAVLAPKLLETYLRVKERGLL